MTQTLRVNKEQVVKTLPKITSRLFQYALSLLLVLHFFGLLGMHLPLMNEWLAYLTPFESFLSLTPFNLILTTGLLLLFHRSWNQSFFLFAIIAFLVGYFIEVIGVATGAIFGIYSYGPVLGIQWLSAPPMIGVNWFLLVYATSSTVYRLGWKKLPSSGFAALLMVMLDYIIEPVAVHFNFWTWEGGTIPLQNFIGWYIIAFVLCYVFFLLRFEKSNRFAPWVMFTQAVFFALQNVLIA